MQRTIKHCKVIIPQLKKSYLKYLFYSHPTLAPPPPSPSSAHRMWRVRWPPRDCSGPRRQPPWGWVRAEVSWLGKDWGAWWSHINGQPGWAPGAHICGPEVLWMKSELGSTVGRWVGPRPTVMYCHGVGPVEDGARLPLLRSKWLLPTCFLWEEELLSSVCNSDLLKIRLRVCEEERQWFPLILESAFFCCIFRLCHHPFWV